MNVPAWKRRVGAIPLLGPLARWIYALCTISSFKRHVLSRHDQLFARQDAFTSRQDAFTRQLEQLAGQIDDLINVLRNDDIPQLHQDIAQLQQDFDRQIAYLYQELRLQQRQGVLAPNNPDLDTDLLAERIRQEAQQGKPRAPASLFPAAPDAGHVPPGRRRVLAAGMLDVFYAAFEDTFRGSRADIKSRLEVYLPYIRKSGAGTHAAPILDIGCGRGEWLELLGDHGLACSGTDINSIMVRQCQGRGLNVAQTDALGYLAALPADSLGALTGFHIVEHLPFEHLLALFDEALRVLRPGGVLVFETPNPENLLVGAQTFHNDPTHRAPLPPPLTEFLARQRGFVSAEILRLHPYPAEAHVADSSALGGRFNRLLYGPQDYALIAWKSVRAA